MIKKILSLLLICVLLISLAGCGKEPDTSPLECENPVCRINLFASTGSYDKRFLMLNLGHSFISVENLSDGSITVGDYVMDKDEEITLSVWPLSGYAGVWYNIESAMIADTDKYSDRVSISLEADESTLKEISSFICDAPSWTVLYNCSAFTLDIYNIITKNEYRPALTTPATLARLFKKYDFETCLTIEENRNVGYFKEGAFEKCELKYR